MLNTKDRTDEVNSCESADERSCGLVRELLQGVGDLFKWGWSLEYYPRHFFAAAVVAITFLSVVFWRIMLPLLAFAVIVAIYIGRSSKLPKP